MIGKMSYREKFKEQERVVIIDSMIQGIVVGYYDRVDDRVKVRTAVGHEWLVKPENLSHLVEEHTED